MSVHTSLKTRSRATSTQRNVLKRHERIRHLIEKGSWVDGRSVLGLPKLKQIKIKARKAAKEEKPAEGAAAAPGAAAAAAPAVGAKPAAAKPAGSKPAA